MQLSLVKLVLLMIASAIAGVVIFLAAGAAFFMFTSSRDRDTTLSFPGKPTVLTEPPSIKDSQQFLGTMGSYNGDFKPSARDKVLAEGPGRIEGRITAEGKPVAGVSIRLALNGSVMSQSGKTGLDGKYSIPVPFGEYRIDGYELDHQLSRTALGGKTDGPRNMHYDQSPFTVAEGKPGRGLDLDYVDPVVIVGPKGDVSASGPIVVSWKPYPDATTYRIQLTEFKQPGDYRSMRQVYGWNDQPVVMDTSLDLTAKGVKLKPGFYYRVEIHAEGLQGTLAGTGNRFNVTDFHVTE